jgi:hypothetical protein
VDTARLNRRVWLYGMFSPRPVSARYAGGLLIDVGKLILAFVAGVEAIFLSDLVIAHILPHVLDHRASLINVLVVAALSMPGGLYIALPIAVLAAVYFVLLRRREAREFIILAGMGRGIGPLVRFAVLVGLIGFALSLYLSGHAEPLSRYLAKRTMDEVRVEAIRNSSIGAGKFYHLSGNTVFAGGGQTRSIASKVFFLQELGDDQYRLVTAAQSQRLNAPEMTRAGVLLHDAAAFDFEIRNHDLIDTDDAERCATCDTLEIVPGGARTSNQILISLPSLSLPGSEPRGGRIAERTSFELLEGDLGSHKVTRALGERLLRGLLVFIAPLIGLLAVVLTRPALYLAALPGGAGLVLAGSFFGPQLVEELLPFGFMALAGMLIAGTIVLLGVIIALIYRFESGGIQHGGVQL